LDWSTLLDVLVLLLAALALGALCESLKQSAILGYLLAGTLLGPNALNWMPSHEAVENIAELGVALLLFTIGLEFSWRRLLTIGPIALGGGTVQVLVTGALTAAVCLALGLDGRGAVAIGAVVALSSTACVLRVLISRAEIDSVYGRNSLGILLLQDMAMVPLVLVVAMLGREGTLLEILWQIGRAVGAAVVIAGGLYLLLKYVVPLLLGSDAVSRNRELPVLLAIVTALGSTWAAHWLGLSPALGAFIAGMLLAESPFSTQIRADVSSLRTLFVTIFFSSIGMLADPAWALRHWPLVTAVVAAVVMGKAAVLGAVARLFRSPAGHALATGICLAQVGEFSFVLAGVARDGNVISADLFKLMVSATIATLFLTPYLVAAAPRLAAAATRRAGRGRAAAAPPEPLAEPEGEGGGQIVIIGFGPAGRRVAEALLRRYRERIVVVELSPRSADLRPGPLPRVPLGADAGRGRGGGRRRGGGRVAHRFGGAAEAAAGGKERMSRSGRP
jgi:CPA2 family monovalent cation:H+ antiporter-2